MKAFPWVAAALPVFAGAAASAAEPVPGTADYNRHIYSAGHKALFMCTGVFLAKRTPDQIRANEFAYAGDLFDAPADAEPDFRTKTATATALGGKIKRIAAYREGFGCSLLGPGSTAADAAALPRVDVTRAPGNAAQIRWPDGDLLPDAPMPAEVDQAKLRAVMEGMFDGKTYANPAATPRDPNAPRDMKAVGVVIVYKGNIVAERYSDGWGMHTQGRTYSAAKSLTNALVGIRVRQGALTLESPINFPEWNGGDPRRNIALRHFLNMASGLRCEDGDDETMKAYFGGGADIAALAAARGQQVPPGTRFCYDNFDTISLGRAVRLSLPSLNDSLDFPYRELFSKIGMRDTVWETDVEGNFVSSSQIWTTPRDLARFGLLYLRDGVWNGERILPPGWTKFTSTAVPLEVKSSRQWGYGGQFWLINKNPRIPSDAYTAGGNGGTYVTIIPSRDLVIVRLGLRDGDYNRFVGDVVEAVGGTER